MGPDIRRFVGVPVWYGDGRIDDVIEAYLMRGFRYVEISLDYPLFVSVEEHILRRILSLKEEYHLEIGIHAPWRDLALASPCDEVRLASLKIIRKCIPLAKKLGARYFNFHIFTKELIEYPEVYENAITAARKSLKAIERLCLEAEIEPIIENNPTVFLGSIDQFKELLEDDEVVQVCLDVGHVLVAGHALSKRKYKHLGNSSTLNDWIDEFKDRIAVWHLHDCVKIHGRLEDHYIFGKGLLNIDNLIERIKKTRAKYILLEIFKSLDVSRKVLIEDMIKIATRITNALGDACVFRRCVQNSSGKR